MRVIICLVVQLMLPQALKAESSQTFKPRVYTPAEVVDSENNGSKGAVQLLWQKGQEGVRYEVQIDNGHDFYTVVTENHFFHTMLYFDKNYRWRVRSLSSKGESGFSQWWPVKVLSQQKSQNHQPLFSDDKDSEELQEMAFDQGG